VAGNGIIRAPILIASGPTAFGVKERDTSALVSALAEFRLKRGLVITSDYLGEERAEGRSSSLRALLVVGPGREPAGTSLARRCGSVLRSPGPRGRGGASSRVRLTFGQFRRKILLVIGPNAIGTATEVRKPSLRDPQTSVEWRECETHTLCRWVASAGPALYRL
jgi:hypothetical protein